MGLVSSLTALVAVLFPLVVPGPVAAVVFITVVKREDRWRLPLFWSLLLVANFVALALMACTFGHSFPGAGFFAYKLTPIAAAISLVILVLSGWRVRRMLEENKRQRMWYVVGTVMIPFLQSLMAEVLPLVRESLCCWLVWLGFDC
jgi:hypothetical protein